MTLAYLLRPWSASELAARHRPLKRRPDAGLPAAAESRVHSRMLRGSDDSMLTDLCRASLGGERVEPILTSDCTDHMMCLYSLGTVAMTTRSDKVRKNLRLSQAKLNRAKRILGAATETETIEQALDLVAFREEVMAGVRRLAGSKSLQDVLLDEPA